MSAFILSDKHFSAIAYAVIPDNAQAFANKLKAVNIASVNYRYGEKTRKSKVKLDVSAKDWNKSQVTRLIECWVYQSGEDQGSIDYLTMESYLYKWTKFYKEMPDYDDACTGWNWTI